MEKKKHIFKRKIDWVENGNEGVRKRQKENSGFWKIGGLVKRRLIQGTIDAFLNAW